MKEIVRASIEDCSQIERFRLVTRLGNAILSNGGEVFRAEQAMEYAARALRLEAFNAYVIANGIFSNVVIDGRFYSSRICYVPLAPTILCRVDALNDLSRKIAAGKCGPYEMRMRLEQIEHMKVLEILGKVLAACVGTAAFSALFGVPKKYWLDCGICGAVGWGVYLAVMAAYQTPIIGTFAASAVLTMLSRCLAIQRKAPTILFLVCGIFPLVPGAAIYYTAYNFFMGQEALALQYGMDTIKMAIAIGLGIGAAYSLPGHLFGWKREIEVWEPGKEGKK